MKTRKALAFILALVMISSLFVGTAAAAPVVGDYTLTGGDVTVDGTADATVDVLFTSVNGGSCYNLEADWSKKELEDSSYFTLNALTAGGAASPMENDPNTGRTVWTDLTFSAPITVTAGGTIWKATYTVAKDTPTGTYTFSINVKSITDGSYDSTTNLNTYTATVNVTNNGGTDPNPPEPVIPEGYSVAASGDTSISVGEDAPVALNVTHKDGNAYNAYYFEVSYDTSVLTYKSADVQDVVVDEAAGTLKIAGYGANKDSGTAAVTLTFTGKAVGAGKVTITKANVDAKANANAQDAPAANIDETTAAATITVGGYSVTLPEGFSGAASAAAGTDYTFKANGDDYGCYDVTATMGGETTTVTNNGDGSFTIKNVTGEIVVTATPKTYAVTVTGTGAGDVSENAATATYKTDYTFKLTKADGYNYTVTVTAGGNTVTATATTEGVYTISGADIKGELIITVEKTAIVIPTTTITITGDTDDVQGGLILTAKNGEDTTFKINKKDGYTYTVKAGDTELTVGADGTVTIPGSLLTGAPLTVTVTKTAVNPYSVEVYEYVKLDGQSIWLVVAKSDSVLAYGADTMFSSEKYGGYCWLVISAENADTVKTEAIGAVKAGSGTAAAVVYTGDVNGTGNIDVNDAQLVYNIYNTEYASFDALSRAKFLAADVNGDHTVTVLDAAAVVNTVLGK